MRLSACAFSSLALLLFCVFSCDSNFTLGIPEMLSYFRLMIYWLHRAIKGLLFHFLSTSFHWHWRRGAACSACVLFYFYLYFCCWCYSYCCCSVRAPTSTHTLSLAHTHNTLAEERQETFCLSATLTFLTFGLNNLLLFLLLLLQAHLLIVNVICK